MNYRTLLYSLLAAVLWGIPPLLDKYALAKASPMVAVTIRSLGIAFVSVAILAATGQLTNIMKVPIPVILVLVVTGLMAGLFAMWAYFAALQHGEASRVVAITAVFPAITFILGVVILHESLSLAKIAGVVLVIAGVVLLRQ